MREKNFESDCLKKAKNASEKSELTFENKEIQAQYEAQMEKLNLAYDKEKDAMGLKLDAHILIADEKFLSSGSSDHGDFYKLADAYDKELWEKEELEEAYKFVKDELTREFRQKILDEKRRMHDEEVGKGYRYYSYKHYKEKLRDAIK